MRELIGEHIKEASLQRTAPVIAEQTAQRDEPQPVAFAKAPMRLARRSGCHAATATVDAHALSPVQTTRSSRFW